MDLQLFLEAHVLEQMKCQTVKVSIFASLKIEIEEGINFFCSLLAQQRAGEMGWGVHWVLCLPEAGTGQENAGGPCLGLPHVGFVPCMSLQLLKVPAGLFLADLGCSPMWASYLISWFCTKSSHLVSMTLVSAFYLFSWVLSCSFHLGFPVCFLSLMSLFFPAVLFARVTSFANINLDLSLHPSPCMFSQQLQLSVAKLGLLILTPRGLSLTSFSESWAKYQHHLLFIPVNSAAFLTQWCVLIATPRVTLDLAEFFSPALKMQHLLSHWELKPSPASLHLVSQLLSFSLSLTNLTFIFEIHRDCKDCCLSSFFWSCHTSLCIPGLNLPSLFYQPIAELFFPGSSWLPLLFISFQGLSPLYQLSPFIYSLFSINDSQIPSYPAHRLLEEFFTRIHAVPPNFFFKILPRYKLVLNLLRNSCICASQRCPKGHLAFSSQRLEFKYKLSGITF